MERFWWQEGAFIFFLLDKPLGISKTVLNNIQSVKVSLLAILNQQELKQEFYNGMCEETGLGVPNIEKYKAVQIVAISLW